MVLNRHGETLYERTEKSMKDRLNILSKVYYLIILIKKGNCKIT